MDVTVVVATFGDESWADLARSRAIPSVEALGVPWVRSHVADGNLADARNAGLAKVDTEFVAHLDADDELEPGYFDHMATGTADVRAPAVRYVRSKYRIDAARMPRVSGHNHQCEAGCLEFGNWLVIGSVIRTDLLRSVGGHVEFEWSEDWSVWRRCAIAGATFEQIPDAVYRAYVRKDSRNRSPDHDHRLWVHRQIEQAHPWPVKA